MKLPAREIESFLRAPGKAGGALIYGADAGQVRQRVAQLAESWLGPQADPMATTELSAEQVHDDPALLADALAALSLMAQRRVVLLRDADDRHTEAVADALARRAPDNFLIAYRPEPLSSGALRNFAERAANFGCVPCYKDEGAQLEGFIRDTLRGYGLRAGSDVVRYLAAQLSGDRQIILNELEKLSLYVGDEAEEITLEDATLAVGENNDRSFDDLCQAVAMGQVAAFCRLSDRLVAEGNPGVVIVRAAMRYFTRLEQLNALRAEHGSIDAALEKFRPPLIFKIKPALKQALARWNADACADALARLQWLELEAKRHDAQLETWLGHGFMEIANLAAVDRKTA